MKAPLYHGKGMDEEGIAAASLYGKQNASEMHVVCVKLYHQLSFSVLFETQTCSVQGKKEANLSTTLLFLKHYLFFRHIIKRPSWIALGKPTPFNSSFRINQVGQSLTKKCLLWLLKILNSFQWFLSRAAIATTLTVSNKQNVSAVFPVGVFRTVKFMCMLLISYPSPSLLSSNGSSTISLCPLVMRCNSGLKKTAKGQQIPS